MDDQFKKDVGFFDQNSSGVLGEGSTESIAAIDQAQDLGGKLSAMVTMIASGTIVQTAIEVMTLDGLRTIIMIDCETFKEMLRAATDEGLARGIELVSTPGGEA